MKNNILIFCFLVFGFFHASSQVGPKFGIGLGWGLFQSKNIGVKAQVDSKNSIGLYIGNRLTSKEDYFYSALTMEYCYHFGKLSKTERPMWFVKNGLIYGHSQINSSIYKSRTNYAFHNLTVGREFYLNKNLSVSTDLGLVLQLFSNEVVSYDAREWKLFDIQPSEFFVLPSTSIQFNYNF